MRIQEKDELRRRFREKLKALLARRGMSYQQVADRTGLSNDWLRKLASEGSDGTIDGRVKGQRKRLMQLAFFCGLREVSDWWSDYMPERDEKAIEEVLDETSQGDWPAMIEAAKIWERASDLFVRLVVWGKNEPQSRHYQPKADAPKTTIKKIALLILQHPDADDAGIVAFLRDGTPPPKRKTKAEKKKAKPEIDFANWTDEEISLMFGPINLADWDLTE